MPSRMLWRSSLVVALSLSLLTSCGSPPKVNFAQPSARIDAADYFKVHKRWTRHSHINTGVIDTAWDAYITLMSDEMRAAYVSKQAAMRHLTDAQRMDFEAAQRADAEKYVDFIVQIYTGRWDWNDLNSTRSLWSLTLRDDEGHAVGKPEVNTVLEKADLMEELFPPTTPFTRSWRVRFPRPLPQNAGQMLNGETSWVSLTFAGALGAGESRWESGRPSRPRPTPPPETPTTETPTASSPATSSPAAATSTGTSPSTTTTTTSTKTTTTIILRTTAPDGGAGPTDGGVRDH